MAEMEKDLLRVTSRKLSRSMEPDASGPGISFPLLQQELPLFPCWSGAEAFGSLPPNSGPAPHCLTTAETARLAPTSAASVGLQALAVGRVTSGFSPPLSVVKNLP